MDLKHRFDEVKANCCDPPHDLRSLSATLNGLILAPSGAGAIHPIVWKKFLFRSLPGEVASSSIRFAVPERVDGEPDNTEPGDDREHRARLGWSIQRGVSFT